LLPQPPDQIATTPCIGICSTIYGDDVCRGCFRSFTEVTHWNTYSTSHKIQILERLNDLLSSVVATKLEIVTPALLHTKCIEKQIKIRAHFSPYTWAHALLRHGKFAHHELKSYGIKLYPSYAKISLATLIEMIDTEIHQRALAALNAN